MEVEGVEWGSRRLGGRPDEDGGDMRRVAGDTYGVRDSRRFGGLNLKTTGWQFRRFGLKTQAEISRRNEAARGRITEVASR
jgi:hypothetical protein